LSLFALLPEDVPQDKSSSESKSAIPKVTTMMRVIRDRGWEDGRMERWQLGSLYSLDDDGYRMW